MKLRSSILAALAGLALQAAPGLAAAADDDVNVSIYDQYPQCLERAETDQVAPKCIMPDAQIPDQKVIQKPDSEEPDEPSGAAPS